MTHHRHEWLAAIKAAEREHASMGLAADRLLADVRRDPTFLRDAIELRHVLVASSNLEATYTVRLFAEFETGLRLYWATIRSSEPPTRDLLDGIAARRAVPARYLANAHIVREHRNMLVHRQDAVAASISVVEARDRLCRIFSFLPPHW